MLEILLIKHIRILLNVLKLSKFEFQAMKTRYYKLNKYLLLLKVDEITKCHDIFIKY